VATRALASAGYHVATADDGVDGVEAFSAAPADVDLVILDATMPRMNGQDAFHEIRRVRRDVPVILCSGYEQALDTGAAGKGGPEPGFLKKPFSIDALLDEVARALR